MIHKDEAIKKGIKIIDSKETHNPLFENLKANFPQTIKDNQVDLKAIATLLGLDTKANIQGYELTFTGKALANALYSIPSQKTLKLEETFTYHNLESCKHSKESKNAENKKDSNNAQNFIIKGDNLDVLKILKSAYSEKIKMIYIDPPYNTKNDNFIYPDNFRKDYKAILQEVGLLEIDDEGNEIESETLQFFKNIQSTRTHSGWLSFMLPRLKLARDLLREDGVIFISIDDNEQANLKILCDEIFGKENFVACLIWQKKKGGSQDSENFAKEHEYILCYTKNSWQIRDIEVEHLESDFTKIINDKKAKISKLEKWGAGALKEDAPSLHYPIKAPNGNDFYPIAPNGEDGRWRKKPENLDENHIFWQEDSKGRLTPYEVIYFDEILDKTKIIKTRTIFTEFGTTTDATKEIQAIFKNKVFDTPKPINLIKKLIELSTNTSDKNGENDIILDFFAGSGTTAQAVMELNAEDKGNRKFILVQIDEEIIESKSKTAYDFCKNELGSKKPVISDITIERVKRAGAKIANANPYFTICFSVLSLSDKSELITDKQGTLGLLSNAELSPFDKALNLSLQSGKTLDKPLKPIFENKLYACEDCLYLVACDKEVLEFLCKTQNEYIFIDGFEDLSLEYFLNLDSSLSDRLRVVY